MLIANCQLPIADFNKSEISEQSAIGNRQSATL